MNDMDPLSVNEFEEITSEGVVQFFPEYNTSNNIAELTNLLNQWRMDCFVDFFYQ